MPKVLNFLPSTCGFKFNNHFPPGTPHLSIPVGNEDIVIGDASKGMCGGMVYAVRDFFEHGIPIPSTTTAPIAGSLFEYIRNRLYASFDIRNAGPLKYLRFMNPLLPDDEMLFTPFGIGKHGRGWRIINVEWPKIKSSIDNNKLSTIALVQVKSLDPHELGHNHQVMVYGYDLSGNNLTLHLYDPNFAKNDNVCISLNIQETSDAVTISRTPQGGPIYYFFETNYIQMNPGGIM